MQNSIENQIRYLVENLILKYDQGQLKRTNLVLEFSRIIDQVSNFNVQQYSDNFLANDKREFFKAAIAQSYGAILNKAEIEAYPSPKGHYRLVYGSYIHEMNLSWFLKLFYRKHYVVAQIDKNEMMKESVETASKLFKMMDNKLQKEAERKLEETASKLDKMEQKISGDKNIDSEKVKE